MNVAHNHGAAYATPVPSLGVPSVELRSLLSLTVAGLQPDECEDAAPRGTSIRLGAPSD